MASSAIQIEKETLARSRTKSLEAEFEKLVSGGRLDVLETINWEVFGEKLRALIREDVGAMDSNPPAED